MENFGTGAGTRAATCCLGSLYVSRREDHMSLFARRANLPEATGYSVVDEQLVIRGEITTEGTIRVDGCIEGRMHRAETLIVGASGVVIGDIEAREVVV